MAPILWVIVLIFMSMATIVAIVNRSMAPDSKVMWLVVTFVPVIGPLLYLMFGERRLSKKKSSSWIDLVLCIFGRITVKLSARN